MNRAIKGLWALAGMLALSACTGIPGASGLGNLGGGPTVRGSVDDMSGAAVRVGLVGKPAAGGKEREITSTAASGGQFSLTLPGSPPIEYMEQPAETRSIVFSLRAYQDSNGNKTYDDTDQLCTCSSGTFRYFTSDGPSGQYKTGWNQLTSDGRYTQGFDTAFNL